MRTSGHPGPCTVGIKAPWASRDSALLHRTQIKREESGRFEPRPSTHAQGEMFHPPPLPAPNRAPGEPAGRWAGWRARQVGQGALPAVIRPAPSLGPQPAHPASSPSELAVPGCHLRNAPGKASEGSTELLRTGPCLSQEPGWHSVNKSKPGAGRQKSGKRVPAKGYDFCWSHPPREAPPVGSWATGTSAPGHIQACIFLKPSGISGLDQGWGEEG